MKIRNLIPFKTSILSAPINKLLGFALILLVLLTSSVASAQLFPVQVSPQLTPPYSLKLSDYSTSTTEKLLVNLLLTDVNESDLQVRLRFSISGNSVNIQSKDFVQNAAPIQLTGGIPLRLSNLDLQPYFDLQNLNGITPSEYSKPLPDGLYQFCFEVFDWTTGRPLSEKKCYPVYLVLNDPPFLNLPQNGEQVPAQDPQNIIFQWTPRHVNATGVEYEFELRELWDTNVDPQAAFLASPNLYQTKGFANTLLYGPGETSLLEGKTYGWRVRAIVSDGISETAVFKNGGYSEIFYFTYTGKCDAPQYILAKSEGTTTEEITWQQNPDHINYQIQFRKEGGSNNVWFESETVETKKKLFFLEAETTYEYRVGGQCVQNGGYSYSAINTFTTPGKEDASEYNCGIPPEIVITNQDPLQLLGVNDVFTAGDFPVTVKEVNGGNGNYTGWGFIVVPYLGDTQIRVTFNNIQINTDKQLTNGIVETEYDEKFATTGGAGMSDVSELTELIEGDNDIDELNVNFVIPPDYFEDYITVEDGQIVIRNPNDAQVRTSPLGDDKVIVDSAGNTYHVDAEGNVTKGGKIDKGGPVNPDNVEGVTKNGDIESLTAKGITVTFNTRGTYGYDKLPTGINNTKLNEEYKTIKDAQGANYEIVNHVAEKNNSSLITATVSISNSDYTIDDLIFKTKQGELLTHTKATNNTINLSVQGRYTFENEPIYAVVKSKQDTTKQQTAGAFNLWHLSRKTVDVVLVSVNGAQLPTAIELNTIFNQAATTLNIETKSVSLTNGLLGADNKLEIGDKPWLNTYNQEQKAIIADLKQKIDYQKDKYYVFTFSSNFITTKSIAGFMPLKRQFGFVFNGGLSSDEEGKGDLAKVTAHEVAHGIFALQHPFTTYGNDTKGKTPWLMDYANGDLLSHMDWAQIHNPNLKFYIFQDEEDGESVLLFSIPEEHKNQDDPSFTFLRLDGGFITLPETVKDVIFTTGLDSFNNFVEMPVGALYGFTIDSVKYTANIVRDVKLAEIIVTASGSTSEASQSNYSEITKEDLTFSFKGYSDENGNFYDNENSKKYYNKLITFLPTSINKSLFSIAIYDLIYKEPSSVNLIDDYNKFIFKDNTINSSTTYDYQADTPFRIQHNLTRELTEPVLDGSPVWTDKRPILFKYAELNNANPSIFKDFFSDKYQTSDYTSVLKSTSLDSLKVEYIELINYFISKRKSLLEEFQKYCDNEEHENVSAYGARAIKEVSTEKLLETSKKLSSEQIPEISIDYRIKGLNKLLLGVKADNLGDLDAQYQNQIFRLLTLIPEYEEEELFTFLTKENYKKLWDYAENLDEEYLVGFMKTYTSLVNKFGNANDRIKIFKELKQREDSWTGQGDDFGNKTEQVISGLTTNLTVLEGENIPDAIVRLEQQKQIIKYFRADPSFLRYAFDAMDNYNDVAPLTNFINTITYWDYKTESNTLKDVNALIIKYDSINWLYNGISSLPNIENEGYIPFSRASWINDRTLVFNFETEYLDNNKIKIDLTIQGKNYINKEYDPLEYVALHIIEDFSSGGYEFKKGELYNVPAIYLHWLDNDIDRVQNLAAFRIAGSVLSIALAPVTFGGSTLLIGIDVTLAATDIYMTVNRDKLIAAGHQEGLELWDATYAIYNIQFLPSAIKSVASGGKAFFNFTESVQGSLKFRKLLLKEENINNAVNVFRNIDNTQDKITLLNKLDDLIISVKNTRVRGVSNVSKNITHNSLLKFKLKLYAELKKNLDIIVDGANTDFKPTLFVKSNNVNHELGLIEFVNTPNSGIKNTIQLVDSKHWLPSNVRFTDVGEIDNIKYTFNGAVNKGKIKIVQDINNTNKFYLKPATTIVDETFGTTSQLSNIRALLHEANASAGILSKFDNLDDFYSIASRFKYNDNIGLAGLEKLLIASSSERKIEIINQLTKIDEIFPSNIPISITTRKSGSYNFIQIKDPAGKVVGEMSGLGISKNKRQFLDSGNKISAYDGIDILKNGDLIGFKGYADWNFPESKYTLGSAIGDGSFKDVYNIEELSGKVIAIMKDNGRIETLINEVEGLATLKTNGIPAVEITEKLLHNGKPAIVMPKYAESSESIVDVVYGQAKVVGQSDLLNAKSVESLENIKDLMIKKEIAVDDLQFLIDTEGRFFIADPIGVKTGQQPTALNKQILDKLIEQAKIKISGGGSDLISTIPGLSNKLKGNSKFVSELSKLTKYNTVDEFIVQFENMYNGATSNSVKSIDKVIEDFDYLITNHINELSSKITSNGKSQLNEFLKELTQTSDKFKAGATSLEVIRNPTDYIPSKFTLNSLELEDLIAYADEAGDFRFDILWNVTDNVTGNSIKIFIDTKNYSRASNMFKDLEQFKAYLRQINNFDEMYYIQQGGRGVTRNQIINRLQTVILDEKNNGSNLEDIFNIIWSNSNLRENLYGNITNSSIIKNQKRVLFTSEIKSKSSEIFNSLLITKQYD
ncbi:hypothetical protein QYR09_16090 [Cellulophaga lytica]|nr:hypothetical protein QYR09_16090 [Cellulophaga lytica]